MKLYLIAALFLATLVVVPCLAEEELKNAAPANVAEVPEDKPVEMGGGGGATGDEEQKDEEQKDEEQKDEEQKDEEQKDGGGGATGDEEQKDEEQSNEEEKEEAEPADEPVPEEFKDEVEQVKRRVTQLSHPSCLILKRYGYCRVNYIARFCVRQCGCLDKLSRASCYKVRNVFKQCRHHIGRVYCKKTCGHCRHILPAQCRRHRVINDITRRQTRHRGNKLLCDNKITVGWYRFVGNTGTYIPNRCVPSNRCGTHAPGWVVGNYPRVRGQNIRRQVCFKWKNNCCYNSKWWRVYINITNCGSYYVFYLTRPRACYYRYCGNR